MTRPRSRGMDPNVWKKDALNLVKDLAQLFRDRGVVIRLITGLANTIELQGRQVAWDRWVTPMFRQVVLRRSGASTRNQAQNLEGRLRSLVFTGTAEEVPDRLRNLL